MNNSLDRCRIAGSWPGVRLWGIGKYGVERGVEILGWGGGEVGQYNGLCSGLSWLSLSEVAALLRGDGVFTNEARALLSLILRYL